MMEIADILVVNKADRDGADLLAEELHAHGLSQPIFKTVATSGQGVKDVVDALEGARGTDRLGEAWLWNVVQSTLRDRIPEKLWREAVERITQRKQTPYDAVDELLRNLKT